MAAAVTLTSDAAVATHRARRRSSNSHALDAYHTALAHHAAHVPAPDQNHANHHAASEHLPGPPLPAAAAVAEANEAAGATGGAAKARIAPPPAPAKEEEEEEPLPAERQG